MTESTDLYGKPASLLDLLLLGKYGNKSINPLMREFTNNIGEVTDMQGLAGTIIAYYKDVWDKRYEALTVDYDVIGPYHVEYKDKVVTEEETDEESTENKQTVKDTDGNKTKIYDTQDERVKDLSESKTGSDTTVKDSTSTNIVDAKTTNDKTLSHENDKETETTTFNDVQDELTKTGSETVTKDGTETVETDHGTTVTDSIVNNDPEKLDGEHVGTEHTIADDKTIDEGNSHTVETDKNSVAPYIGSDLRPKSQNDINGKTDENNNTSTHNLEMERTVDYSIQDSTSETSGKDTVTTEFKDRTDTTTFNNRKDTNVKSGSIEVVKENEGEKKEANEGSSNESSVNVTDATNTQIYNTENKQEGTDTINKTGSENVIDSVSEFENKDTTAGKHGTLENTAEKESEEKGNKWNYTNQGLINEELELRKNNFYEMMLRDVASLITLSVYA